MTILARKPAKTNRLGSDALAFIAKGLVSKVPALNAGMQQDIAKALHELLDGRDEMARKARIEMQHHLIQVAESLLISNDTTNVGENLLTTEQAAELMQCSRPYVAMLIDNKKLLGATVTEGGHRRVPESSVRAWIKAREDKSKDSDYKAAAAAAGMYDIPEQVFVDVAKKSRKSHDA